MILQGNQQMAAISRTTVQARYIFGGDEESAPPYRVDLTAPDGVTRLTTAAATRHRRGATDGCVQAGPPPVGSTPTAQPLQPKKK